MANKISKEDVSIDHLIGDRHFEPQRLSHSYIHIDLTGLTDARGNLIKGLLKNANSHIQFDPTQMFRLALSSHGMPNQTSEVIKIRKGNEVVKFAGGVDFDDISVAVTDWIGADMEGVISAWDALRYNPITGMLGSSWQYKKTGKIVQYSPDGEVTRTWTLLGAWIDSVNYGDYDRTNASGEREISFVIHVDKAYPDTRDAQID